jgi:tRNA pseudouridine55 synthase
MVLTKQTPNINFLEGAIILVDKPFEWTSFDVVKKLRNLLSKITGVRKIKVGHAGTLDPLATGLLIICTGKATKKIASIQDEFKKYDGIFKLGATTPSYDLETEINEKFPVKHIDATLIDSLKSKFTGEIEQTPPIFSAIKKDGKRAYESARKGIDIKLDARKIKIHELILALQPDHELHFEVSCSKGTYIRTLANDIGKALQSGAYLKQLRRTQIGDYTLEDAWEIEELINFIKQTKN